MQVGEPVTGTPSVKNDETKLFRCDWKNCKENHLAEVDYADKKNVKHNSGDNKGPLEDAKQTPWGIKSYGMLSKDQRKYGFMRPQWSYPDDEDYYLAAKKSNIQKRINSNKFKQSDLPPSIVQIILDPNVKGSDLIALAEHSVDPKVAKTLSTRNCFPYREQFADWSEKKRRSEGYPPIQKTYNYPCEAHHLLSKQFFGGELGGKFSDLNHNAELIGWNVDAPENGIMLPRFVVDIVCHGLPQHEGNHNATDYNESVAEILKYVQKYSLKLCKANIEGKTPTSQKRLIARLNRASRRVRKHIMQWHKGFLLRPDNLEARDAAYRRINVLLLFDEVDKGYPLVPPEEQP